jgi:hypothetical protein
MPKEVRTGRSTSEAPAAGEREVVRRKVCSVYSALVYSTSIWWGRIIQITRHVFGSFD